MRIDRIFRFALVCAFAGLQTIGGAGATSANIDLSDIWWNPYESGWGMQLVNTGTFVFATIYVYGPDGNPAWYGGGMNRAPDGSYTGKLYASTGPWFGGPFNPAGVNVREVGTLTFVPSGSDTAQLSYSVDGVQVTKSVQRQPLTLDDYSGMYVTSFVGTLSGCANSWYDGLTAGAGLIEIEQSGASMSALWLNGLDYDVCSYSGTYSQLGRMGRFDATYSCDSGKSGTATFTQMTNRPGIFNASIADHNVTTGCNGSLRATGLSTEE